MGWGSKHRKEVLKLSCVLDSSPIRLTKVRIKMLMIIIIVTCSLAVNNIATVQMCLKIKQSVQMIFLFLYIYHKSTNFLINIRNNK